MSYLFERTLDIKEKKGFSKVRSCSSRRVQELCLPGKGSSGSICHDCTSGSEAAVRGPSPTVLMAAARPGQSRASGKDRAPLLLPPLCSHSINPISLRFFISWSVWLLEDCAYSGQFPHRPLAAARGEPQRALRPSLLHREFLG